MRAYSVGLRKKLVGAIRHGKPKAEVARILGVGISSAKRYMKVAEETVAGSQEGAQQDEKAR